MKLYIDNRAQYLEEILELLPVTSDKSLKGYHRRMSEMFDDYCLVCDELLQVASSEWGWLRDFVLGLYRHVGFPAKFAEVGLYLGNYRTTPFGVHVDGCGVFSFPVEGTKHFRLWGAGFVEKNPALKRAHQYATYKRHSQLLVAKPGDMTYWPSSHWHVGESNGSFHATWSIGVWLDEPLSDILSSVAKPLLSKKMGAIRTIQFEKQPERSGLVKLPKALKRNVSVARGMHDGERIANDTLLRYWLTLTSKNGFRNGPAPNPSRKLNRHRQLKGNPDHPILWATLASGKLCIAVNGFVFEWPKSPARVTFLKRMNSGTPFKVSELNRAEFNLVKTLYGMSRLTKVSEKHPKVGR